MKTKNFQAKRQYIKKEKRTEKKHYLVVIVLFIFAFIYYYYFEPKTVGYDIRYNIFIFWLPSIIGIITIGIYRRQFLINKLATNKSFIIWGFMIAFYLLQGFIFSYLSFGQVAKISWDAINHQTIRKSPNEKLVCNVTRFWSKRRSNFIEFTYNGKYERINTGYFFLKSYIQENPKDYEVIITAQKGLWNHYFVNDWMIQKKIRN